MKHSPSIRGLAAALFGIAAVLHPVGASAQAWPERPITLVMPYVAGGATDVGVRDVARKMSELLGQPIVVDNKPGASATIGAQFVARAKPDGYTLLAAVVANMVTSPLTMPNVGYDPLAFEPVSVFSVNPIVLVASKQSGIKSYADLVARARAKPGDLAVASYGLNTPSHLAIELLKSSANIELNHIPYNGSAPAVVDLLGGNVPLLMDILPSHIKTMENGQVVGIAVGQATRSPLAPQLPTFKEAGLPNFEATTWFGMVAPAGTPPAIIAKLNEAARRALDDPALQASMLARGTVPKSSATAKEFGEFIRAEHTRWRAVIDKAGLRAK